MTKLGDLVDKFKEICSVPTKTYLTLSIHSSGTYIHNVVRGEDLWYFLVYNVKFRPRRIIYVNGMCVYDGVMKSDCFDKYDKIAHDFFTSNNINIDIPTLPYS